MVSSSVLDPAIPEAPANYLSDAFLFRVRLFNWDFLLVAPERLNPQSSLAAEALAAASVYVPHPQATGPSYFVISSRAASGRASISTSRERISKNSV